MRVSPLVRAAASLLVVAAALAVCPAVSAAGPAERALDRARALFAPASVHARGHGPAALDPHEATLVLRDLRAAMPLLSARGRAEAESFLARPTNESTPYAPGYGTTADQRLCSSNLCIHWVHLGTDAPPLADTDGSGVPDWVETNLRVFEQVWAKEIGELGYRAPLSDLNTLENGGDGRLDVYLADVASQGFFGWCTSDDPATFSSRRVSAFCVIDDDYANKNLHAESPLAALRATAAHEFFHTVQFGYDWLEDLWLLEGSATWMEDEVFDGVNDNLRYLRSDSPLKRPDIPLDLGSGGHEYGAWIFWRYLSERLGPGIVRKVWNRAGSNEYSLEATRRALNGRGRSFTRVFAGFAVANRIPGVRYEEGVSYPDRRTSATGLGGNRATSGTRTAILRHLSSRTVAFRPTGGGNALRVSVSASRRRGAAAALIVHRASGKVSVRRIHFRYGRGTAVVPFAAGAISSVDLVLTNAGTAFRCWQGTALSCSGVARDDKLRFAYVARVV